MYFLCRPSLQRQSLWILPQHPPFSGGKAFRYTRGTAAARNQRQSDVRRRGKFGEKRATRRAKSQPEEPNALLSSNRAKELSAASSSSKVSWSERSMKYILPIRYRASSSPGSNLSFSAPELLLAMGYRIPLWIALAFLFSWDQTSPYRMTRIHGPSMIPVIAADGSDIWLVTNHWIWLYKLVGSWMLFPSFRKSDLVGWSHPDHPGHVSCKRIIGLEGDKVQRFGQYVHLYVPQDPSGWGILWPDESDPNYSWMDRSCKSWDADAKENLQEEDPRRIFVVPPGHVWIEGDCPGLAIDSRHYGPIPLEWVRGKISGRLWPIWKKQTGGNVKFDDYKQRPHPIPLDVESLREQNVHHVSSS